MRLLLVLNGTCMESKIYFCVPIDVTLELFEVNYPELTKMLSVVRQVTQGDFDVNGIVGQVDITTIVFKKGYEPCRRIVQVNAVKGTTQQLTM